MDGLPQLTPDSPGGAPLQGQLSAWEFKVQVLGLLEAFTPWPASSSPPPGKRPFPAY